jgi:hypothetical protein
LKSKNGNIYYVLPFILIAFSCYPRVSINPKKELIKNYEIAKEYTSSIGEAFIEIENGMRRPAFTPIQNYKSPMRIGDNKVHDLSPGDIWVTSAINEKNNEIVIIPLETLKDEPYFNYDALSIHADGTIFKGWINSLSREKWINKVLFKAIPDVLIPNSIGFKAELIYTGVADKTIHVTYREYNADLARPAFYQDLSYQLEESKIIAFKSLKIMIYEANNSSIRFSVLDDGGLPWIQK